MQLERPLNGDVFRPLNWLSFVAMLFGLYLAVALVVFTRLRGLGGA